MNRILTFLSAILLVLTASHAQPLPAFPGAEGYGSIATGGRGGDVYFVTNLNPSGAGSFAEGVATAPAQGRTILFKVSGHIRLSSTLNVSKSKITIAGQSAPGDGICLWNKATNFTGSDLVIRNIRFRYGKQTAGGDAVNIGAAQRIIFDHCDVMFSTDENMSSFGAAPEHMTFQWSTNAWGLQSHSAGGLWKVKHATVHHTLWANNHTRNPKLIGGEVFDWVNNLTFGWDNGFNMAPEVTGGVGINHRVNIRNSSFVHGGSTTSAIYGGALNDDGSAKFKLHMADAALDGNNNGILDVSRTNYQMVSATGYSQTATAWPQTLLGNPANPVIGTPVTVSPRLTSYKKIISKTGAVRMEIGTRPLRDEITQLCVTRAANLQRGIISDPLELNLSTGTAFASLLSTTAPADTDLDGMPDDWEDAVGYDKTTADNNTVLTTPQTAASFFPPGSPTGYTRLEEYLHFKAVPHGIVGKNTAASPSFIDIDLRKFTSGFTASPAFTISNITGGTITQSGPGNAIVRFTPALDTSGRAGFLFTVTDSAGDTWTQQCCLLVSTKTQPRPITWIGDGTTNNWDTSTNNFTSILGTTAFTNNDAVTINDSGSNTPDIQLQGTLLPASVTISNSSKNFILAGPGTISGTASLTKSGTATLTLKSNNSYTGGTLLDAGTLVIGAGGSTGNIGSGQLTIENNGIFSNTYASGTQPTVSAPIHIPGGQTATLRSGNRITLTGAITGAGDLTIENQTTVNRLDIQSSVVPFTGKLIFTRTAGAGGGIRTDFVNGFNGFTNASISLATNCLIQPQTNSGGNTFAIGSLTGAGNLSGGTSGMCIYSIGGLNDSTTYSGAISGNAALTKTGTGTLTLTGNSTHSGATNINLGSLELLGTFGTSPVNVAENATLTGTGTMAGPLATVAGAILAPGADDGAAAGILSAASLILTSPTLRFDLSNNPAAGNDRIQATGAVSLTGAQNFIFNLTNGILGPGTYELITTPGTLTASGGVTLTSNLPTNSRQTLTLEHSPTGTAPGYVRLVVSGTNADLTWTGTNGGIWDQQTTTAWTGASPATFYNFDGVTFDDTTSNGSVIIAQPVSPRSLTVNNTAARPYTFTGAPITGSTSLVKSGTGSLTLNLPRYDLIDCSITTGSPTVTVSSTTGMVPGMTVVSRDNSALIPAGTTIVSVANATTITLSQNATATSTTARIIFETRNTFSGGTILNDGSLTLASNSWEYYSSAFPPPSNPFGLGTGPITLNGGTLTLLGHSVSTLHVSGALPNNLIVPAGKTATLRSVMRGTYLNDIAGLRGNLTGSGTLNLVVNYAYSAITGDWSGFSGTLNVTRPAGANDPRFQLGNDPGLPLATVSLDQVTLTCTAAMPPEGLVIPIGSLSGTGNATTIIAGAETGFAPVTWQVGALHTSTTFAGNFTPYGNAPIGLAKTGTGTWTLTGTGTVSAGITVENGTLSYGDAATDTLAGTSEISIEPTATLQLNNAAQITGSACEIFIGGTLRGYGTLQAPLVSNGSLSPIGGHLSIIGDADLSGSLDLSTYTDRLAVTGNLNLAGIINLPSVAATPGRKLLATYIGTLTLGTVTLQNIPANYQATLDTATPGEVAVVLQDQSLYQAWQLIHFTTLENPDGQPTADPDNDGMINQEEFEAGTDPKSNASFIPLVWQGGGTNPWDLATTANWLENTTPRVFRDKRHLTINDTGSNSPAINLTGTLAPGSFAVSNSTKAFTLGGTGSLSGTTGLVKSGTATLTLATPNTYSGTTAIDAGVVTLQHAIALGSATGGTTVANNARLELEGNITVIGESLTLAGTGGSAFFNGAINSKSGINTWTGPITVSASGTRVGAQVGATLILSGPISSTTGITIRPNDMTATVILSGANNYSGDTSVIGGVLKLGAPNTLPIATALKFGSSSVSGKLDLNGYHQEVSAISVTQTTGTLANNEITSAAPAVLTVNLAANTTYSGKLTGSLTLAKSGNAILSLTSATALAATNSAHLDAGVLNLSSSHTITALRINGVWQPADTYNSANSSGSIAGAGSLTVTASGPAAFTSWIDSFSGLSTVQKLPYADPDNDGHNNLAEFAFAGNPTSPADNGQRQLRTTDANNDALPDLTLTLEVRAGTAFTADGPDLVSPSIDSITYRIQGSTDLSNFTSPVTEVIPHLGSGFAKPGYTFKTFRLTAANGLPNKGFLRASAQ